VVWAVAKGSFINKLILVPMALLIGTFAPAAIVPLLMVGGLYLCFEGCEKLAHSFLHRRDHSVAAAQDELAALAETTPAEKVETESEKIKGAVRTDFVLSAEIIAITLGTVKGQAFPQQLMVLSAIALIMTVGVYGLVAAIVKMDDAGLYLTRRDGKAAQGLGRAILWLAPLLMKSLSILGTAAMFLVGGGIVTHGIPWLHHAIVHAQEVVQGTAAAWMSALVGPLLDGICGLIAGTLVLLIVLGFRKFRGSKPVHH
jgi:predicted DNA repair protein MutK